MLIRNSDAYVYAHFSLSKRRRQDAESLRRVEMGTTRMCMLCFARALRPLRRRLSSCTRLVEFMNLFMRAELSKQWKSLRKIQPFSRDDARLRVDALGLMRLPRRQCSGMMLRWWSSALLSRFWCVATRGEIFFQAVFAYLQARQLYVRGSHTYTFWFYSTPSIATSWWRGGENCYPLAQNRATDTNKKSNICRRPSASHTHTVLEQCATINVIRLFAGRGVAAEGGLAKRTHEEISASRAVRAAIGTHWRRDLSI